MKIKMNNINIEGKSYRTQAYARNETNDKEICKVQNGKYVGKGC